MIRNAKQVIDEIFRVLLLLADNEVAHIKSLDRELHRSVLLLLHALEPFQIDNQNRRSLEDLNLFHSMLMHFTSTAEPSVLVRELLRCHKLSETVINSYFVILIILGLSQGSFLRIES